MKMTGNSILSIEEFLNGVIRWIAFTSSTSGEDTLQGLVSGRLVAEALCSIDPDFFVEDWYEALTFDPTDKQDDHVKMSTQREIIRKIYEYYQLKRQKNIQAASNWKVDVPELVEHQNSREIKKLSVLLMGVAVVSQNTPFMKAFEELGQEMLQEIQSCIKVLEDDMSHINDTAQPPFEYDFSEWKQLQEDRDRLRHQVKDLLDEKEAYEERERDMMSEISRLNHKINDTVGYSVEKEKLEMRNQKLQDDFAELEANFNLVEKERDEFRCDRDDVLKKYEDLHVSYTESEADNRKLKDHNSELAERLRAKEAELVQLRTKTDKDVAREIADKERESRVLEDKCRTYVKELAELESVSRRNDSLSKQLNQANAMFEEQSELRLRAESQVNYYKNELAKQATRIEELEQHRLILEARLHHDSRLDDFKDKDHFDNSHLEDCTTTSNCSSPSLNEEFTSMHINFEESRFYHTIDELKVEKQRLSEENQKLKEEHEQKLVELNAHFEAEKSALKEENAQLHQRIASTKPNSATRYSWLKILTAVTTFVIVARLLVYVINGEERFTLFGTLPNPMVEYISQPPM